MILQKNHFWEKEQPTVRSRRRKKSDGRHKGRVATPSPTSGTKKKAPFVI